MQDSIHILGLIGVQTVGAYTRLHIWYTPVPSDHSDFNILNSICRQERILSRTDRKKGPRKNSREPVAVIGQVFSMLDAQDVTSGTIVNLCRDETMNSMIAGLQLQPNVRMYEGGKV